MVAKITRTVFKRKVILTWFNETTREVKDTETNMFDDVTESDILKNMTRTGRNISENGKLISVRIIPEAEEFLASMPLDEFCKNATLKPVNKETSKTGTK